MVIHSLLTISSSGDSATSATRLGRLIRLERVELDLLGQDSGAIYATVCECAWEDGKVVLLAYDPIKIVCDDLIRPLGVPTSVFVLKIFIQSSFLFLIQR